MSGNSITALLNSPALALAYAAFIYAVMFAAASVLVRRGTINRLTNETHGRVGALDGLRGVLSLGVFVHHSTMFPVFATTGAWVWSDNSVLRQAGQSTVALFFMITGLLFTLKSLKPISWAGFYEGRIARLAPLYFVVVFAVVLIVFISSNGELREPPLRIVNEIAKWLAFVVFGGADINAFPKTWLIIAGVNWSLKYEVIFYVLVVPVLSLLNRIQTKPVALVVAIALFAALMLWHRATGRNHGLALYGMHFLAGIIVAYAYSIKRLRRLLESIQMRWIGGLSACALLLIPDSSDPKAIIATMLVFGAVVGNGSLFGVLKSRSAIWLGDVSFGIYLLHGMMLWLAYKMLGIPSNLGWFLVSALVLGLITVMLATASYLMLELPVMRKVKAHRKQLTSKLSVTNSVI